MNEATTIGGGIAQRHSRSAASVLVAVGRWVQRRFARAGQRRHLAELDPRLKSDIGVTQVDVMSESAKPFWR
jgi:uncharacterized protein YjiS (DUF1127 family)